MYEQMYEQSHDANAHALSFRGWTNVTCRTTTNRLKFNVISKKIKTYITTLFAGEVVNAASDSCQNHPKAHTAKSEQRD